MTQSMPQRRYRLDVGTVLAVQNEHGTPQDMTDQQGQVWPVPPGWWLVEGAAGPGMLSNEAFQAKYKPDIEPVSADGFAHTLEDLRHTDRLATVRSNQLEERIAALEAMAAQVSATLTVAPIPNMVGTKVAELLAADVAAVDALVGAGPGPTGRQVL
jgi:hypothetical protein